MIKTSIVAGKPKVTFKGSDEEIKQDLKRIFWSLIQNSKESRQVLVDAVNEVNEAFKQITNS